MLICRMDYWIFTGKSHVTEIHKGKEFRKDCFVKLCVFSVYLCGTFLN